MKQMKYGKKVQNWHKPLAASALKQRYLRLRDQEPVEQREQFDAEVALQEPYTTAEDRVLDENGYVFFDSANDHGEYYYYDYQYYADKTDYAEYLFCSEVRGLIDLDYQPEWKGKIAKAFPVANEHQASDVAIRSKQSLAKSMFEHYGNLEKNDYQPVYQLIQNRLDTQGYFRHGECFNILKGVTDVRFNENVILARIITFAPYWLKAPASCWSANSLSDCLRQLFVVYEPPTFLYRQWSHFWFDVPLKWHLWFIVLSQGGSLQTLANEFGWNIPKGFQHYLYLVPENLNPERACLYAEIHRLGGDEELYRYFSQSQGWCIDPTDASLGADFLQFWQSTVRWLVANDHQAIGQECTIILYWAWEQYHQQRAEGRQFSWKGRRLATVLERSRVYAGQLDPDKNYHWQNHGLDWAYKHSDIWTITELTSSSALKAEGVLMRHCVGGYTSACLNNSSAIFSLKKNNTNIVTVEINPDKFSLIQAKGVENRLINNEERAVINLWLADIRKGNE